MVVRVLRIGSIVLSLVVVASWAWFVTDQTQAASQQAQHEILSNTSAPDTAGEASSEKGPNAVQRPIDRANDLLLRPFTGVVATSDSDWTKRSIPALLALLTYGVGLATLARYLETR